jgi:predicted alpha-1,2-mannosidase
MIRRVLAGVVGLTLLGSGLTASAGAVLVADPTAFVDPLIGTGGDGFTVPGATTPFGMTMVSPDTISPLAYSGYSYEDAAIRGFSLIHVNGAGVAMGGELPFLPLTAAPLDPSNVAAFAVPFTHATETAGAGSYGVTLGNGVQVALAATPHGGLETFTPLPTSALTVLADIGRSASGINDSAVHVVSRDRIEGSVLVHWRGGDFTVHFSARFSSPFVARTFVGAAASDASAAHGKGAGALLTFPLGKPVTVAAGVSYVDLAGARKNLAHEIAGFDLPRAQNAARSTWRRELSRILIGGGTTAQRRTFYTSLYRSFVSPDVDSDLDGRYRGADGNVHRSARPHYENFSLWDTIRGENALLATLVPDRYTDMIASLSAFGTQAGALPRWSLHNTHPDYMNGDPAIATVAEAVCRGLVRSPEAIYQQARHLAFDLRPRSRGWIGGSASDTLEFADADFALALMARRLGHSHDATVLTAKSQAWKAIYHEGFLQPRAADGSWPPNYDPTVGDGYREGTGWQYLWLAPHDQAGLQKRYDADGYGFAKRLDAFFSVPVVTTVPGLPVVPQVQSAETAFGTNYRGDQYVPGNEHDLEAPYAYNWTDRPSTGQAVIASARSLFLDNPLGLPGNDDLGSLSGWYVWSAIGFYPSVSGAPLLVTGTPLFPTVQLTLGTGKPFTVDAPGASPQSPYVATAALNGQPLTRTWFTAADLRPGGSLTLTMATAPTRWGSAKSDRPPSVSTAGLAPFGC